MPRRHTWEPPSRGFATVKTSNESRSLAAPIVANSAVFDRESTRFRRSSGGTARAPPKGMEGTKVRTGDAVRIRGERWRIAAESAYDAASIVEVHGCDAFNRGIRARFILPFEPLESLPASS